MPDNILPIAICAKKPDWFDGLHFIMLKPRYEAFKKYKEDKDFDSFSKDYRDNVLSNLDAKEFVDFIENMVKDAFEEEMDICFICYEKNDFECHRSIVREWLNSNGIECKEYRG